MIGGPKDNRRLPRRVPRAALYAAGAVVGSSLVAVGCGGGERTEDYVDAEPAGAPAAGPVAPFTLVNVAGRMGIDFVHETGAAGRKWMPETLGSGGGFFDYDGDGWPDLLLVNGSRWPGGTSAAGADSTQKLYRNLEGRGFSDVTVEAGLDLQFYGMGATFADFDADGDMDVFLTALGGNRLLRNDAGWFRDVTRRVGLNVEGLVDATEAQWSTCAAWLDVDRDGWLDLFVCNYVRWSPETDLFHSLDGTTKAYSTPQPYQGQSNRLFRSIEGRRFEDVTESSGVFNANGKSLGVAIYDFDDDGWPDIFVANDTEPNFLYSNDGDGSFTDVALAAGVGYDEFGRARAGMGVDVAEPFGGGRPAIAIGNFSGEPVSLFSLVDRSLFRDRAGAAGLTGRTLVPLTFGLRFADFDLDGDPDMALANGHIEPGINAVQDNVTFAQPPQLFLNDGAGRFSEVSRSAGADFSASVVGRGLATADIDRDGDLDLLLTVNGAEPRLFRNDLGGDGRNWIRLRLREASPNRNAIGARVDLFAGDLVQRRTVRTGSSYLTQSEIDTINFGLGEETRVDSVLIRWPTSGSITRHGPFDAGTEVPIEDGS